MRRSEGGSYPWDEYLLFNPYRGYRWLVTDGRGWSLGEMLTRTPEWSSPSGLFVGGERYEAFFRDTPAQVDYVLGEFYWRVAVGEEVRSEEQKSELQSLMRISYADFCLKKKKK